MANKLHHIYHMSMERSTRLRIYMYWRSRCRCSRSFPSI